MFACSLADWGLRRLSCCSCFGYKPLVKLGIMLDATLQLVVCLLLQVLGCWAQPAKLQALAGYSRANHALTHWYIASLHCFLPRVVNRRCWAAGRSWPSCRP